MLTSSFTLANGGDSITVKALWDLGSESSFFSADLIPFAVHQQDRSFKIETLSLSASKPEVVHGLEAAFQVVVPGGETVTLRHLQHTGMELQVLKLKSKILTSSKEFANTYDLERAESCTMDSQVESNSRMDVHHVQPKLVEKFSDKHGFLGLYACFLTNTLITCGNRIFPYSPEEARGLLVQHTNIFGLTTEDASDLEEDNLSSLPSTALFHSALQEDCQMAQEVPPCNFKRINTFTCQLLTQQLMPTQPLRGPPGQLRPRALLRLRLRLRQLRLLQVCSVWFIGFFKFGSVRFSGNYGANIRRISVPCNCNNYVSSSGNTALLPLCE